MKSKVSKKKTVKALNKRFSGYWNSGYELRRDWMSKKFGSPENKEANDALRGTLQSSDLQSISTPINLIVMVLSQKKCY
ncbi:MAG: hypothetical protein HW387_1605 [Parachlamydiales bacterium]|nr:hypothetical protein [Parachlamydiales bacterium]